MHDERATELAERLGLVRERISNAANRVGRTADSVKLVAVSKRFPMEDILALRECGVECFGENRPQELDEKARLRNALDGADARLQFHMIGHLQRNKVKLVVGNAHLIHSVDSIRVAKAIDDAGREVGVVQPVLIQVNISGEENKHGFAPDSVVSAIEAISVRSNLEIVGLMGMAAFSADPELTRPQFRELRVIRDGVVQSIGMPLNTLSMGMSNDFEVAIEEGATMVRVGSLLFGERQ